MKLNEAKDILKTNGYTLNESTVMVYVITGIIPYSNGEKTVIAVYLNAEKAKARYDKEINEDYYCDVNMEEFEVED